MGFRVTDKRTGAVVQKYEGELGSGALFAADGGRSVVFVQSHPVVALSSDGTLRGLARPNEPLRGVAIFRGGSLVGDYELNRLLVRPGLVKLVDPDVVWVRRAELKPRHLLIETTSLRILRFDLLSGRLESEEDSKDWKGCAVIARAETVSAGARSLEINAAKVIKGKLRMPTPIPFSADAEIGWRWLCFSENSRYQRTLDLDISPPGAVYPVVGGEP